MRIHGYAIIKRRRRRRKASPRSDNFHTLQPPLQAFFNRRSHVILRALYISGNVHQSDGAHLEGEGPGRQRGKILV